MRSDTRQTVTLTRLQWVAVLVGLNRLPSTSKIQHVERSIREQIALNPDDDVEIRRDTKELKRSTWWYL